jgi:hypothetical protein
MPRQQARDQLERTTRKWWFFVAFILLQGLAFFPFASKNFALSNYVEIAEYSLGYSLIRKISETVFPVFKIIPMILIVLIFIFRNRISKLFSIYVGISYIIFAVVQNMAITDKYGLSFITVNVVMFIAVSVFWFREASLKENDFDTPTFSIRNIFLLLLALFAFWTPGNPITGMPDFNPAYFFTQNTGLAFCLMTPVYLALLILYYPKVNIVTLRITGLVGLMLGIYNLAFIFAMNTGTWYVGVLHFPLTIVSGTALILSLKRNNPEH